MANVIETIIIVIMIIMYVMTWVAQPKLSLEYTKSYITSGKTLFMQGAKLVKSVILKGNSTQDGKNVLD